MQMHFLPSAVASRRGKFVRSDRARQLPLVRGATGKLRRSSLRVDAADEVGMKLASGRRLLPQESPFPACAP